MIVDPSVSIIFPVYNASPYLREAINSILYQTYVDFEFIIINDGSIDDSDKIIRECIDHRIIYIKNEINLGLIRTLNIGLDKAKGKYIVRMDADDIANSRRLELQIKFLDKNPSFVAIGGAHSIIGENKIVSYHSCPSTIKSVLLFESPIAHPCLAVRSWAIKSIGYHSSYKCAEDFKLLVDLSKLGHLSNLETVLLQYRKHDNQISTANFKTQKTTHTQIVLEQLYSNFGILAEKDIFYRYFIYEKLQWYEYLHLAKCYFKALLKTCTDSSYDNLYIFKRFIFLCRQASGFLR